MDDNLVGLIIFIIVGIIGVLGKLRKGKPELEEPWEGLPEEMQDIPERARELLFGKRAPETPAAEQTGSRELEEPMILQPRQARPRVQQSSPIPQEPQTVSRGPIQAKPRQPMQRSDPTLQRSQTAYRRPMEAKSMQAMPSRVQPVPQEEDAGPRMRPQDVKPMQAGLVRKVTLTQPHVEPPKRPAPVRSLKQPVPRAPGKQAPIIHYLRDLNEVKRGIVISEILGPPVGLRRQ